MSVALVGLLATQAEAQNETAAALRRSVKCREYATATGPQRDCEFSLGRSLRFFVAGIGQSDAAITVTKSDMQGDFYISVGVLHGCAIIKPTKDAPEALRYSIAFVSPATGLVYETWQQCAAAGRVRSR
jgi:hypothetical protein